MKNNNPISLKVNDELKNTLEERSEMLGVAVSVYHQKILENEGKSRRVFDAMNAVKNA